MKKAKILLALCLLLIAKLHAQVSFPFGNVLHLNTTNDLIYLESRILFNTGKYYSDDYRWEKVKDSLDKRWFVTACFNGDCRNDLLQSGSFIRDFGLNDTSCFIAFHLETFQYPGTSIIKYNVYNKKNASDSASLVFNISYMNPTEIPKILINKMELYPNPVFSTLNLISNFDLKHSELRIMNTLGQMVLIKKLESNKITSIDLGELDSGIYIVQIKTKNEFLTYKIFKH